MTALDGEEEISSHDYFRVDLQHRLPAIEVCRREAIKVRLEAQYGRWWDQERQRWPAILHPDTVSFLGLNWNNVLPEIREYLSEKTTSFSLLSRLHLCTISPTFFSSSERPTASHWLYEAYRRYAIRVEDHESPPREYLIPLIDATVVLSRDPVLFEDAHSDAVSKMLPLPTSTFRVITFPQTRFSFLQDQIFQPFYPLPEDQFTMLSLHLRNLLQGPLGYHNALAVPFTEDFHPQDFKGKRFSYFAALYPVINYEFMVDYENRKRFERVVPHLQCQDRGGFPVISQSRYSRKFDFTDESLFQSARQSSRDIPEGIQSARALFEYSCGDLDTLSLDRQQTSLLEEQQVEPGSHGLLQVDPLWLLIFPESDTICAYRNDRTNSQVHGAFDDLGNTEDAPKWCQVLLQYVNNADNCLGCYEPTYRARLAKLQLLIYKNDRWDQSLVSDLSKYVAELAIICDPLQAQINILQQWREWAWADSSAPHSDSAANLFKEAIKARDDNLKSLKRLQERARDAQTLVSLKAVMLSIAIISVLMLPQLFQLSNLETSNQQSQMAQILAQETALQVELARKAKSLNEAILIFTITTVVFLPLSFFTSYFGNRFSPFVRPYGVPLYHADQVVGMNTSDFRNMDGDQKLFWAVAGPPSILVVLIAMVFAFRSDLVRLLRGHLSEQKRSPSYSARGLEESTLG